LITLLQHTAQLTSAAQHLDILLQRL